MESRKMGSAVLYGVGSIFILAILSSFIFSILLRFTSMTESSLTYPIMIMSFISMFAGGFISGGKGKKQGWLLGGGTGLAYAVVVLLFQYLGHDTLFTLKQLIYYICFIITSMMGAILGVNLSSGSD
ncbi:TIGR04086 family membrane protein [Peribacillus deserti]|uniref:TIGR04086 family membrane protein n=1 Tax=Peribacillus deserti TaxID=673318 RepID=A0A2N5M948_9BACI|nr:TIGR04086 family membrane protein [Peribacillus deserti]PLT30879.1 TIGR04086 family membrane protein [Peribacillus deserti]